MEESGDVLLSVGWDKYTKQNDAEQWSVDSWLLSKDKNFELEWKPTKLC